MWEMSICQQGENWWEKSRWGNCRWYQSLTGLTFVVVLVFLEFATNLLKPDLSAELMLNKRHDEL